VPVPVHAAIGADIIHQHPSADGAALGATSYRDFRRLAGVLPALHDGGVVLNLGSAVVMPEVFLKALTVARNLNAGKPTAFTACDCDMQRHYRPRVTPRAIAPQTRCTPRTRSSWQTPACASPRRGSRAWAMAAGSPSPPRR